MPPARATRSMGFWSCSLPGGARARMAAHWGAIQAAIWSCTTCTGHARVAVNIRQQTELPQATKLLLVSLAPPYQERVIVKTVAKSPTNDASDALRLFLEQTLGSPWADLRERGLTVFYAVKGAVFPGDE